METIYRLLTSKTWAWLWLSFSIVFFAIDLATGAIISALVMGVLSLLWVYLLYRKYQGLDTGYNQYHGKQV